MCEVSLKDIYSANNDFACPWGWRGVPTLPQFITFLWDLVCPFLINTTSNITFSRKGKFIFYERMQVFLLRDALIKLHLLWRSPALPKSRMVLLHESASFPILLYLKPVRCLFPRARACWGIQLPVHQLLLCSPAHML